MSDATHTIERSGSLSLSGYAHSLTAVRLALFGKPLPRVEDSVRIGELVRDALMHIADRRQRRVSPIISGHDLGPGNRHGHAFYLPEDADGDGHIDHVLVYAGKGLGDSLSAFDGLTRLYDGDKGEWQVVIEGYGNTDELRSPLIGVTTRWVSVTPYLHPWFRKRNRFGYEEQIARECRERGLPEPEVAFLESIRIGEGRERRPLHFHRFRKKRGLRQPDRTGRFAVLTFPEPVRGPLALGFGCHFGLGMFVPNDD